MKLPERIFYYNAQPNKYLIGDKENSFAMSDEGYFWLFCLLISF